MKKVSLFGAVCMSVLMAVFMVATGATASGNMGKMSAKTYQAEHAADMKAQKMGEIFSMAGTVKAVDPEYNTAVVECPLSGQMFTVAGPLAPKADLLIGGKTAQLKNFTQGEHVNVKWQATENGHLILRLAAK
jgi:hypothetical protein